MKDFTCAGNEFDTFGPMKLGCRRGCGGDEGGDMTAPLLIGYMKGVAKAFPCCRAESTRSGGLIGAVPECMFPDVGCFQKRCGSL